MLGMVFTEFLDMVEARFGPAEADALLTALPSGHDGAYTAVGYYPAAELVGLIGNLSQRQGLPVPELVRQFGRHLFGRFTVVHGEMIRQASDLFDLVARIDGHIHVEVRKLYSEATLPRFEVLSRDAQCMQVRYRSAQRMESLALGLLEGAAAYFNTPCEIRLQEDAAPDAVLITLEKRTG